MNLLRRSVLSFVLALGFGVLAHAGAPVPVYNVPLQLGASEVTESNVTISSLTNTTVLAANADRLDFQIQLATCTSPGTTASLVYYSYDGSFTVATASSTPAFQIDQNDTSGLGTQFFVKPDWITPTGAIVAQATTAGCVVTVQEWTSTSPILR